MADLIFNGLVALFCGAAFAGEASAWLTRGAVRWYSPAAAGLMCLWALSRMVP